MLDLQRRAEGGSLDAPVIVGEAEQITADRPGTGQAHGIHGAQGQALGMQVGGNGLLGPGKIGGGQDLHRLQLLVTPQGEACVGAADITDQRQLHGRNSRNRALHRRATSGA